MAAVFDMSLRNLRRARAARLGKELFLYERAFADCLDRLDLMHRRFSQALLIGCEDPSWLERLGEVADWVQARDELDVEIGTFDLVMAIGRLDTIDELPLALRLIRHAMAPGALFLGAISGGDTLPQLRAAMRAADAITGAATAHAHPRIEASALAPVLSDAGFIDPVVDVDRASVSYPSLPRLVDDLRRMGATNILTSRPRFISKAARAAAVEAFTAAGEGGRTLETFEILHFAAWTAKER